VDSRTTGGCWPRNDVSDGPPVLWQYSFSNYNEKARWALDFKGIPHRRRSLLPGSPRAMAFSRRGGTLPVVDLDGERIADSTRIIEALEARQPEPALYPEDPEVRRKALEIEAFFTDSIGHDMRRVGFWEGRDERAFMAAFLATDHGAGARVQMRAILPVAWQYVVRRYGFDEESFERSKKSLVGALDRIEAERAGRDYLVGEDFTVADLTAAALLYPMVWPPEFQYELPEVPHSDFRESVGDHPALAWISETWRRHRGTSATV
jgi:glutathione S-transferase